MSTAARHLPLLPIVLVALALRLYGLNWDDGFHLHPDERFIAIVSDRIRLPQSAGQYFSTATSPLNPYNNGFDGFAYGTLPLFAGRLLGELAGYSGYDRIVLLGRFLSALADVGTVVFVYLLGSLLYGRRAGLFGAAVLALAVLPIQLAHFYAFDTFLTFFAAWTLHFAYRVWLEPRPLDPLLLGIGLGGSVACKISALILLPIVALALLPRPGRSTSLGATVRHGLLVALSALLVYRLAAPYAFLGTGPLDFRPNPKFVSDMLGWIRLSSGENEVPFMIQWAYTPKYSFVLESIVRWGLGPAAGLAAFGGLLLALVRLVRWGGEARHLLLVAWVLLNLFYFGGQFAKFMRYLLPVYPALAVLAGYLLATLWDRGVERGRAVVLLGRAGAAAVLLLTGLWALAFVQIYSQPNTRLTASEWIYDNLPPGATLALEHWDDALPLPLASRPRKSFRDVSMNLYDDENPEKLRKLLENLEQADYIVLASNRLYGSIPRLPQRYPLATAYYRALFDGRLGFERVAEFTSRPRLLGLEIVDDGAQEDFTVYDHPKVEIFQKGAGYDLARVANLLGSVPLDGIQRVKPVEAGAGRLPLLSPTEWAAVQRGGTWSSLFDPGSAANQFPVLAWWLAATALGLAVWPLLHWLTPGLADRGYGLARPIGLLGVAYLAWLLASVKLAPFGRWSLLGGLVLVAGLSLLAARSVRRLRAYLGRAWPALLASEAAFSLGFALGLALRAVNPDLWHGTFGGEKPMDFAYLNAVIKSDYFPPYDPWFAGGSINYYYFGFVLVAALVKLTGIVPAVAYNLALALWFGFLSQAAFSLAYNLSLGRGPSGGRRGRLALVSGALAVVLVGLVGNLDGAAQLRDALWKAAGARFDSGIPVLAGLVRTLLGLGALLRGEARLEGFDFWRSTRLIGPEEPGPITEFPFFTFLYGDLHAHLLALPLTLAAVLLSLALARERSARSVLAGWPALPALVRRSGLRLAGLLALLGLVVGALRATNTWDYPTYLAIGVLGLASLLRPLRREQLLASLVAIGAGGAALFALSATLFAPYLERYQLFYAGVVRSAAQTALSQFLTVNGHWLFVLASVLVLGTVRSMARDGRRPAAPRPAAAFYSLVLPYPGDWPLRPAWLLLGLAVGLAGLLLGAAGLGTLALLLGLEIWLLALLWQRWRSPQAVFRLGLAGLALAVLALPDLVTLKGDVGRMNTVFKFYLQAWVLLAVLAAVWAPRLAVRRPGWRLVGSAGRRAWLVAAGLLLLGLLIYPLRGGPIKLGLRFEPLRPGLDGMAFMALAKYRDRERDVEMPADYAAIRWLQREIQGSPVILEASIGLYKWGSRVSTYTGLPTVLGWDWHQTQQRVAMAKQVEARSKDVRTIYESSRLEQALPLLRKYGVRYIYVGGVERLYYPNGVGKFEQAPGELIEAVYREAGVTIYLLKDPA